jgi:hypothetical protein
VEVGLTLRIADRNAFECLSASQINENVDPENVTIVGFKIHRVDILQT